MLITHSSRSCFNTCRRKYMLRYIQHIERENKSSALRFGSAYHLGLECINKGHSFEAVAGAIRVEYANIPAYIEDIHAWQCECVAVVELLRQHPSGGVTAVASELSFGLPVVNPATGRPSPLWKLAGKLDAIGERNGRQYLVEYKTTSSDISPESDYWRRLRIDGQISTYVHAARALGYQIDAVLYDVTRKPALGFKKLTTQEYADKLRADIYDRAAHYYATHEVPRLDSDMTEWQHELWDDCRLMRDCELAGRWSRNANACVGWGTCEYLPICADGADPNAAPYITSKPHQEVDSEKH